MVFTVNGKAFTKIFKDFIKGRKVMVNFKVVNSILFIQVLEDYTVEYPCPVTIKQLDNNNEISVWVDKSINILMPNEEVEITITEAVINITQGMYQSTLIREYEERREFIDASKLELTNAFSGRLKYLTHCILACSGIAKELGFSDPDPVFSGGKLYADYQQAFLIERMAYPEMCLSLNVLRDFVFKLEEDAKYCHLPELNTVFFQSGSYVFWIPTVNHNIDSSTIKAVEGKLRDLREVTTICIKEFADRLNILTSAFPKQQLNLTIGTNCFNVTASANNTYITVGRMDGDYLLSKHITSAQLNTIVKLFKDEDSVTVLRGGNCICLRNGEKDLLIAGLIY